MTIRFMTVSFKSIRSKIAVAAIAAVTLTAGLAATSQDAQASKLGTGLAIGVAAGALFASGAYAAGAYGPGYYAPGYDAPVRCHWRKRFDAYGYYIGKVRVCY